jgi:hypothetical protein
VINRLIGDVDRNSEEVGLVNNQTNLAFYHPKSKTIKEKPTTTPHQEQNPTHHNPINLPKPTTGNEALRNDASGADSLSERSELKHWRKRTTPSSIKSATLSSSVITYNP